MTVVTINGERRELGEPVTIEAAVRAAARRRARRCGRARRRGRAARSATAPRSMTGSRSRCFATRGSDLMFGEIAGRSLESRLILGTGGFRNLQVMAQRRRVRRRARHRRDAAWTRRAARSSRCWRRPASRCCRTRPAASPRARPTTAKLAREALETDWVKLEVIGDDRPCCRPRGAARGRRGARGRRLHGARTRTTTRSWPRLEDAGCAAVMPPGSPIGMADGDQQRLQPAADRRAGARAGDPGRGRRHRLDAALAMEAGCDAGAWRARSPAPPTRPRWPAPCERRSRRATRAPGRPHPAAAVRAGVLAEEGLAELEPEVGAGDPAGSERRARPQRRRQAGGAVALRLAGRRLRVLLHAGRDLRGPGGGRPAARGRGAGRARRRAPRGVPGPGDPGHLAAALPRRPRVRAVASARHTPRRHRPDAARQRPLHHDPRPPLPRAERRQRAPCPRLLRPLRRRHPARPAAPWEGSARRRCWCCAARPRRRPT